MFALIKADKTIDNQRYWTISACLQNNKEVKDLQIHHRMSNSAAGLSEAEIFDLLFRQKELQKQPAVPAFGTPKLSQSEFVSVSSHQPCCRKSWISIAIATCALFISIGVAVALVFVGDDSSHGKHKLIYSTTSF